MQHQQKIILLIDPPYPQDYGLIKICNQSAFKISTISLSQLQKSIDKNINTLAIFFKLEDEHQKNIATITIISRSKTLDDYPHIIALSERDLTQDEFIDLKKNGLTESLKIPINENTIRQILNTLRNLSNDKIEIINKNNEKQDLLDPSMLRSIKDMSKGQSASFFDDYINAFISSSKNLIGELKNHLENNNIKDFTRIAHSLKGSCGSIGSNVLMKKFEQLEHLGKKEDISYARDLIIEAENIHMELIRKINSDWR